MEEKKYIHITTGIETVLGEGFDIVKTGDKFEKIWNPYWLERLRDYEGFFRLFLTDDIIKAIGDIGWCVNFVQMSPYNISFLVDISVNDAELFPKICAIIKHKMPNDFQLQFFLKPKHFTDDGIPM